nr:MAG TPA: hypothetical protein [Caudoviricetes sp.]
MRGGASQRLRDAMSGIDKQRKGSTEHSEGIAATRRAGQRNCVDRCCSGKAWHRRVLQWRKINERG